MRKRRTRLYLRRRRGPRAPVIVVAIAFLAAFGAAAVTTGEPGQRASRSRPQAVPTLAGTPLAVRPRSPATARGQRREWRAISATLRYTPFIAGGTPRHPVVALTFDDGPSPYTAAIVRILVRMHVPATFFIVGQQLNYFSAGLRDELAHRFEIGDHTENHAWLARLRAAAQIGQIRDAADRITRLGAPFPHLFRPPYGAYNRQTIAALHRLKMLMVMWSIDPGDWRRPGAGAIVANVLANARSGAIVILHDGGGDRSQTIAALPGIINGLRRRHYRLVSVPKLITLDPPPRNQRLPHLSGV